jgi:CRISPR-associated protein Csx10
MASSLAAGNYSRTLDYISGAALRGALATAYLNRPDIQRQVEERLQSLGWSFQVYFDWLFLSGLVRFPNLYPRDDKPSLVIPLSARTCKRWSGFAAQKKRRVHERPHGVFDILLFEPSNFRCSVKAKRESSTCQSPMEPFTGFYESDDGRANKASSVKPQRRVLTRTAIEYATESVRQGSLYSLESVEEGGGGQPFFAGWLNADAARDVAPEHHDLILSLLREHLAMRELSIGGAKRKGLEVIIGAAKTRGLGRIKIEIPEFPTLFLPPIEERFDSLQQMWRQKHPDRADETVFTLTLNSDAIVLDELWRCCSVLGESLLARETPDAPALQLQPLWFTATRIVSGWNVAHRLPKEDEMTMVKGAAFLYTTPSDRTSLLRWLERIEEQGIGARRNEGFGQVIACHPFHWEVPKI